MRQRDFDLSDTFTARCPVCRDHYPATPWQSEALYAVPGGMACSRRCAVRAHVRKAA